MSKEIKTEKELDITIEKLKSILSSNNISFSDISKIANIMNTDDQVKKETTIKQKITKSEPPKYSLSKVSYPDFVITRKSKTQTKELVIAPSCDGYFIRTLKQNGQWDVENLNEDNYCSFMSDFPTKEKLSLPEDFYVRHIEKGKVFGDALLKYLKINGIKNMIKDKCAPPFDIGQFKSSYWGWGPNIRSLIKLYSSIPLLYKEIIHTGTQKMKDLLRNCPAMIVMIYRVYGIEKARDFIKHYNLCLYDFGTGGWNGGRHKAIYDDDELYSKVTNLEKDENTWSPNSESADITQYIWAKIPLFKMDYERFKEYFFYESYRMGYSSLDSFVSIWTDTLRMEWTIFGKIKEKYPKNLPVYHNKMVRRLNNFRYNQDETFKKRFIETSEKLKKYEYCPNESTYQWIIPKTVEDVVEEADSQSNCLVSCNYMQRVLDGTSILVFMRKKEDPDSSYITMEICNGAITQAYLASNKNPCKEDREQIKIYADHFGLVYRI